MLTFAGYIVETQNRVLHFTKSKNHAEYFCKQHGLNSYSSVKQVFKNERDNDIKFQEPHTGVYEPDGKNLLTPVIEPVAELVVKEKC